jgi:prolyl-tRNA editing enzyme YbaK/EbsC (Cys-tRNA(Pro) deacylase)
MTETESASVLRVRAALAAAAHPDTVRRFAEGTRTAEDAAASVGCTVAQIAKSMIFREKSGGRPVLVVTSGANRVDPALVGEAISGAVKRADAEWVRAVTGFAIGGVSPVGHVTPPLVLLDEDLLALDPLWAAAGTPMHVFKTDAASLLRMTGAKIARVRAA